MRYTIFLISILLYNTAVLCQSKNLQGKVIYLMKSDFSKIKNDKISKNPKIKKILEDKNSISYELIFKNSESIFQKIKKLQIKSSSLSSIIASKGIYYTNSMDRDILHQKESFGELFLISYPYQEWEITQEKKQIGNYECYKAICEKQIEGRWGKKQIKIVAWFTHQIPVNFGPKEFSGLPGLILELKDRSITYIASSIQLNIKEKVKIKKTRTGKRISLSDYNKTVKELFYSKRKALRRKN